MVATATRRRLRIARALLAVLPVLAVAGCAKEEPPPQEYQSLKDQWTERTTVSQTDEPEPVKVVYAPLPAPPPRVVVQPAPRARPLRQVTVPLDPPPATPKQAEPARRSPPTLAISPPKAEPPPPAAQPAAPVPPPAQPRALVESDLANCGQGVDCLAVLQTMIADPTQSWMVRAPTPEEFANGTRLFAYRALKSTLECGKLRFASAELDWAIDTFHGSPEGVDVAHRARVAALAEDVHGELQDEIKRRC